MERCVLRAVSEVDCADVYGLYGDDEGRRYLGGAVAPEQMEGKFATMLACKSGAYHVARRVEDGRFVGLLSLDDHHDGGDVELSYQIASGLWGQGYGLEVCRLMLAYAFSEMGLVKVVAETQLANEASCKLLAKLGMRLERTVERFGAGQGIFAIDRVASSAAE